MYETTTKPNYHKELEASASIKRTSSVEESMGYLRDSIGMLEDLVAGVGVRLSPVLNSTSVPHPPNDKAPAYGVPLADAIQLLTGRIGSLNSQVRDLHDRLGV